MSGDCKIVLQLGNLKVAGDRVDVCVDIMRNLRNINGESLSTAIDSYMGTVSELQEVEESILQDLVDKRRKAKAEISTGSRAAGALANQEFKWRDMPNKGRDLQAYLDAVDELAAEITQEGEDVATNAVNIGAFIDNRQEGRYTNIFSPKINSGDLSPVMEPATPQSNPLMSDPKITGRIRRKLKEGEFIMDIVGAAPPNLIENHFRQELENESTFSGGIHGRENYDTFVAIIGKKVDGKIVYVENAEGESVPDTHAIMHTYSPHGYGSNTDVSDLVQDETGMRKAVQDALAGIQDRMIAELAEEVKKVGGKTRELLMDQFRKLKEQSDSNFTDDDIDSLEFETVLAGITSTGTPTMNEKGEWNEIEIDIEAYEELSMYEEMDEDWGEGYEMEDYDE